MCGWVQNFATKQPISYTDILIKTTTIRQWLSHRRIFVNDSQRLLIMMTSVVNHYQLWSFGMIIQSLSLGTLNSPQDRDRPPPTKLQLAPHSKRQIFVEDLWYKHGTTSIDTETHQYPNSCQSQVTNPLQSCHMCGSYPYNIYNQPSNSRSSLTNWISWHATWPAAAAPCGPSQADQRDECRYQTPRCASSSDPSPGWFG